MKINLKRIKSFDVVVASFCIITGIYMLFGLKKLELVSIHIFIRVLFLFIIVLLINAEKYNTKFILFIRNFYPLVLLGFFYSETDYYNNLIFNNLDPILVNIENHLFGTQLSIDFSQLIPFRWFSELMHLGYFSYYLIILGIPLLFYSRAKDQFNKIMFITINSFCIYYLIFILFPSIGPQFYFPIEQTTVPDGYLFHQIMTLIIHVGESQTGAFPSSHVGMSVIFLIISIRHFKPLLRVLIPVIIILILSTIYIKAHYAIDVIGGFISGFLFYYLSDKIYDKFIRNNNGYGGLI